MTIFNTIFNTISDERLADIVDYESDAQDWEITLICAELLARRAQDRALARFIGRGRIEELKDLGPLL